MGRHPNKPLLNLRDDTAQQLDNLSQVSATDVITAALAWRHLAPARFRTLLDAGPHDPEHGNGGRVPGTI